MTRMPRPRVAILIAALVAYLAFLLLGNIALNTGLSDSLFNRKPERFQAQWRRAFTWWPGYARFWDVDVTSQARRLRWRAQTPRVDAAVAWWPLLRRELRLTDVVAQELQFDIERVEHDLLPTSTQGDGWIVHLERLRGERVQRLRWDEIEATGAGSVEFALWKQLRGGAIEILPSRLQLRDARVTQAGQPWLQQAEVDLRLAMARHLAREVTGAARWKLVQADLDVRGEGPHASGTLGSDDWLRLDVAPGGGRIAASLALREGALQPGGRATVQVPMIHTDAQGARSAQQLSIELGVDDGVTLHASLPPQERGIGSLDANLRLTTRELPLAGLSALAPHLDGDVALDWRFESLRWLSGALVQNDWLSFDGAGQLRAQLEIAQGRLAIGSRVEIPAVELSTRILDERIRGRARAQGELIAAPDGGEPRARLNIALERFAMSPEAEPDTVYVQGTDLKLDLDAVGDLARLRDTLSARLQFERAQIPDLTAYNRYLPRRNLAFIGGRGLLDARFELDAAGLVGQGRTTLSARGAALQLSDVELRGDVVLDARLERADLEGRRFDLSGTTLRLDNVGYRQGEESGTGWWARVALPRSSLVWGRPLHIDGRAEVRMKDVGFVLALFSKRRDYPKWVLRLIDVGEATLQGIAQLRGDALVLDRVEARNRRFAARARLRLHDQERHGDLLLTWGKLDVGVELRDTRRKWRLRRAQAWFEQGKPLLPASN